MTFQNHITFVLGEYMQPITLHTVWFVVDFEHLRSCCKIYHAFYYGWVSKCLTFWINLSYSMNKIRTVKPQKWIILCLVICKNHHFQVTIKTVICEVLHSHLRHLQGMITLNANHHLARSITFEAVICEVLLYYFWV